MRSLVLWIVAGLVAVPLSGQEPKTSRLIIPAIGSAPETGLQFGLAVMRVKRPAPPGRPTIDQAFGLLTAKHQYQLTFEHDGWSRGDRWRRYLKVDLLDFPLPYFGIGADANEEAEEWFTSRTIQALAKVQRRIGGPWYGLAIARVLHSAIRDAELGGVVASGRLTGAEGGTLVQPGVGISFDTRDDVIGTERGRFLEATFAVADKAIGSDFSTQRTLVDGRSYRRLGPGVIAAQGYLELNAGIPSFDQMSLVGNKNVLRGYTKGRYRDRALAAAQVEWRAPIRGRWRYAVFGGVGGIGDSFTDLGAVVLPTYGAGIRFRPFKGERSSLRLDYARGRLGSSGIYIAIDEAF